MSKFICVNRIPTDLNLHSVSNENIDINANGLSFMDEIDLSNFLQLEAGQILQFDLSLLSENDSNFDSNAFNIALEPIHQILDIFEELGLPLEESQELKDNFRPESVTR